MSLDKDQPGHVGLDYGTFDSMRDCMKVAGDTRASRRSVYTHCKEILRLGNELEQKRQMKKVEKKIRKKLKGKKKKYGKKKRIRKKKKSRNKKG